MADRPIIFSGPMVWALLESRKTQTRRLATSPLRNCAVGDHLYVRESWSHSGSGVWSIADARISLTGRPLYMATHACARPLRWWPSIHMPREFSRLTLVVEQVMVEPLQAISRDDSIAEGLIHNPGVIEPDWWKLPEPHHQGSFLSPVAAYRWLWNDLHDKPGQRWEDNPDVVALTFRVVHGNIDRIAA